MLDETSAFAGRLGITVVVDENGPAHLIGREGWSPGGCGRPHVSGGPRAITELGPLLVGAPALTKGTVDLMA